MKRGEIYYIHITNPTECEIAKGRPGIIVSHDALNDTSPLVEVVYLTTQPKEDMPTHVTIRSSGKQSTALCEQVNTVSKVKVGDYYGTCTAEEMAAVDLALLSSLGIKLEPKKADPNMVQMSPDVVAEALKAATERDIYKNLYEHLLDKVVTS